MGGVDSGNRRSQCHLRDVGYQNVRRAAGTDAKGSAHLICVLLLMSRLRNACLFKLIAILPVCAGHDQQHYKIHTEDYVDDLSQWRKDNKQFDDLVI